LSALKITSDNGSSFMVAGYAVVFGGQDVVGDSFTAKTDFWFDRLTHTPPVLYQHGKDELIKRAVVGRVVAKRIDDVGLWIEAQITASKQYADAIRELVAKGVLGWSSGSVPHLIQRTKSATPGVAEITSWPIVEISLTPTPAEPRTIGVKELKALAERDPWLLEIAEDAEKAQLTTDARNNLSGSDFAYVDSSGGRHLPINDEAHVRAAMSRFNQTSFESPDKRKAAARKIRARANALGIDISADSAVAAAAKGAPLMDEEQVEEQVEQGPQDGAAARLWEIGTRLRELALIQVDDRKAMDRFHIETKDGHRMYDGTFDLVKAESAKLLHQVDWTTAIREGEDGLRRVNYYKHRLALINLEASA
jgi:HK97 family phage prohead protease